MVLLADSPPWLRRYSGQIFCDQACSYTTTLPDLGWYTPQRIYDSNIGIASTEMLEDLMLYTDRKSELVATLVDVCKKKAKVRRGLE